MATPPRRSAVAGPLPLDDLFNARAAEQNPVVASLGTESASGFEAAPWPEALKGQGIPVHSGEPAPLVEEEQIYRRRQQERGRGGGAPFGRYRAGVGGGRHPSAAEAAFAALDPNDPIALAAIVADQLMPRKPKDPKAGIEAFEKARRMHRSEQYRRQR